jgi:hypothetical protein
MKTAYVEHRDGGYRIKEPGFRLIPLFMISTAARRVNQ